MFELFSGVGDLCGGELSLLFIGLVTNCFFDIICIIVT